MKSPISNIFRLTAAAFLLTTITPLAAAQEDDSDDERSECERAVGRESEPCVTEAVEPEEKASVLSAPGPPGQFVEFRLPVAQIGRDLDYLKAAAGFLSQAASQSGELDFKAAAKLASEIRKRAARLKDRLALPRPEGRAARGEAGVPLDPGQLRAALSTLAALISEAVRNPVLRGYVLDRRRSAEAQSALEEIVGLSGRIRVSSEMLDQGRR